MPSEPTESRLDDLLAEFEERVAAALELPDRAREVAFAKLRAAHPEHAALLERCERAAESVRPDDRSMHTLSAAMRADAMAQAPEKVGDYKILDLLGEGGMGIVYLAEQEHPVRRRVALKLTRVGMARDVLARFEVERHSLEMMNHPNIARVLDAGIASDGRPYFVLEHVPGIPIHEFCDRNRLDLRARIELFQKVCHGVQHAHQKGIIHRDLKPSNILVQQRDGFVEPKIIDFGVAKAVQQRLTEKTLYTEQGRILGTPEYMSPEQAEMSGLDIDTRSDVYSLGVLLYQLLAGVLPMDPAELRRAGYYEMQRRIREDEPIRPSTRVATVEVTATGLGRVRKTNPRQLATALKGDLDWIVMRCLEKDPARRYPSASELAADLQRHLDDEPVFAGPPSALYQLRKLARKYRRPLAAGAAVVVALVVGLGLAVWQWSVAEAHAARAEDSLRVAQENEVRALGAESRIKDELRHNRALVLAAASDVVLETDPVGALHLALEAHDLDPDPRFFARVRNAVARQHLVAELEHTGAIRDTAVAERSGRVLTAGEDGTVKVWSLDGELLLVLEHPGALRSARFSSDERWILTVCTPEPQHEVASAFDAAGQLISRVGEDGDPTLFNASWNSDGTRLLVAEPDVRVTIRDREGAVVRELLPANEKMAQWPMAGGLAVGYVGHDVAVVTQMHATRVWWRPEEQDEPVVLRARRESGTSGPVLSSSFVGVPGHRRTQLFLRPSNIAVDPGGERIATVGIGNMYLWDKAGNRIAEPGRDLDNILAVEFSPSGAWLMSTVQDGSVRIWTRDGQQSSVCHHGRSNMLRARWFGSDERLLTTINREACLFSRDGRELLRFALSDRASLLGDVSAQHGLLLTTEIHGPPALWRVGGIGGAHLVGDQDHCWGTASTPTGEVLTTGTLGLVLAFDDDGLLDRVFDTGTGARTYGVAVSPGGETVVAGGGDGVLYGWDFETTELRWKLPVSGSQEVALTSIAFVDRGRSIVAVMGPKSRAVVIDVATGKHRALFGSGSEFERAAANWVRATRSGEFFAIETRQGSVLLCDAEGNVLADLKVATPGLGNWRAAFHPGGRWLATGGDRDIEFWDVPAVLRDPSSARPAFVLPGAWASWSPDGARMLRRTAGSAVLCRWQENDPESGEVLEVFVRDDTESLPSQFSADGCWLLGGSLAGARRWPVSKDRVLGTARRIAERSEPDLDQYGHLIGERVEGGDDGGATQRK